MTIIELFVTRREGRWMFVVRQDGLEQCVLCSSREQASGLKAVFEARLAKRHDAHCLLDYKRAQL